MPKIINNEDGTKTFTMNTSELYAIKALVDERVPNFKKVLDVFEGRRFRATVDFVKSVMG